MLRVLSELSPCDCQVGGVEPTCAANGPDRHAEDEAGLVSLSFSPLHHVHGKVSAFGAVFVQDLYRRLSRVALL